MEKVEKYSKQYLKREIQEIENSVRKNELPLLSIYEKAIIYKYSEDGYEIINENLRKYNGKNKTEFGILLESILAKLSNFEYVVYRGVNLNNLELTKYIECYKKNEPIIEPVFISASKSRLIAMEYRGNTLFRINSKTGKDIERIAKYGIHNPQNEHEVLFSPNKKFIILDITN